MPVHIGAKPDSGPGDPVGWLSDCHRRIEQFLGVLETVVNQVRGGELTAAQSGSLENALRYFREAAPKHTADEDESLFPRLRSMDAPGVAEALELVAALEIDHREADKLHADIDELGTRWLYSGRLDQQDATCITDLVRRLAELYSHHIDIEDNQVFPVAQRLLSGSDRETLGLEMQARRKK